MTTISGTSALDPADCLLDNAVRVVRGPGFGSLVFRDAEDQDCPYTLVPQVPDNRRNPAERVPELAGHGLDRPRCFEVLVHEKRGDQIVFRERDFTQERLDIP